MTKYAAERFIEVVLEIDTPAHTLAVGKSHPEMMTDCWEWMANSGFKVCLLNSSVYIQTMFSVKVSLN